MILKTTPTRSTKVGKLFWESTASTTSTLSTTTQCFVTSGAVAACGRKKRSIEYDVDETRRKKIKLK